MQQRADDVARTRQRIVEAAVRLHGSIGPAATTVTALAEEAGVTRLTVYRHFPDPDAVFAACSAHWAKDQRFPDPATWADTADGEERLRVALTDVYRFYREAEPMLTNVRRDRDVLPAAIRARTAATEAAYVDVLLGPFRLRGKRLATTRAAIAHAVSFWTWRSLCVDNGVSNADALRIAVGMVMTAAR